jgi:hypothetical protein
MPASPLGPLYPAALHANIGRHNRAGVDVDQAHILDEQVQPLVGEGRLNLPAELLQIWLPVGQNFPGLGEIWKVYAPITSKL